MCVYVYIDLQTCGIDRRYRHFLAGFFNQKADELIRLLLIFHSNGGLPAAYIVLFASPLFYSVQFICTDCVNAEVKCGVRICFEV